MEVEDGEDGASAGRGSKVQSWEELQKFGGIAPLSEMNGGMKNGEVRETAPHGAPRPGILSPWRQLLSLPIPLHVHWP